MKKCKVSVLMRNHKVYKVDGWKLDDEFAFHRLLQFGESDDEIIECKGWTITHLKTGLSNGRAYKSKQAVLEAFTPEWRNIMLKAAANRPILPRFDDGKLF